MVSLADRLPSQVSLRDVSLRDGLQDEAPIATDIKVAIFEALVDRRRPRPRVDQLRPARPGSGDGRRRGAVRGDGRTGRRVGRSGGGWSSTAGAERALAAGLTHLQYVVSVSDTHSRHNAGAGTDEALDEFERFARRRSTPAPWSR